MIGKRIIGTAVLLLAVAGCGGGSVSRPTGVEVSGKVVLANGSPLTGGTLIFRPVQGIHGASAQIQKDGSFELVDPEGNKTVVPGKYQVFVRLEDPSLKSLRSAVNVKYQNSEDGDSDVVVDIQEANSNLVIRFNR